VAKRPRKVNEKQPLKPMKKMDDKLVSFIKEKWPGNGEDIVSALEKLGFYTAALR